MWLLSAFVSLLTTNLILTKALGTSTLMAASRSRASLAVLALMMTGFSALGCMLTGLLVQLAPVLWTGALFPIELRPLLYTLSVSFLYLAGLLGARGLGRERFSKIKKYIHLSAFNCAVMGTLYLAFDLPAMQSMSLSPSYFLGMRLHVHQFSVPGGMLFGLQTGLGFVLAALMLAAVRKRLYHEEVPAAFRGFPAVMVYLGLLSMAVYAITC